MVDYTKVTHRGWFSRLGGALKSVLVGIAMLVIALALQFWNEGRTVKRDAVLVEGRSAVVAADAAVLAPANQDRLVHVTGDAEAGDVLGDPAFGVEVDAIALRREVEMFQWQEKRESREESQIGGGTRTVTEYTYVKQWDDDAIDSSAFEQMRGHENPGPLPYDSESWRAGDVRVGAYALSPAAVEEIDDWEELDIAQVQLPENLVASFRADDEWFVTSENPDDPAIGDVRVRFEIVPEGTVSIVARQRDGVLVPYLAANGGELLLVEAGAMDAPAMFHAAASRNATTAWLLRLAGFILAWVAFAMILRPLAVMADIVPVAGRIAGFGVGLVSAVLALVVSVLAIGSGWLFYRPWLLVILVVLIVGATMWLLRRRATGGYPATTRSSPDNPPPPPPR